MKKIIFIALTLTVATTASSFAAAKATPAATKASASSAAGQKWIRPYGMAGCGLGSMAMGRSGGQISAATTNGTSASQYFGITSGTSNCLDDPNSEVAKNVDFFITTNRVAVAGDIARGGGETIQSLSSLMGCADSERLGSEMKRSFSEIFPSHKVQPNEVTDSIITVIKNDSQLSAQCGKVS